MKDQRILFCLLLSFVIIAVNGDSNFAGASVSSDSSGTRSVLITGRNGAAGGGVVTSRVGGSSVPVPGVRIGTGSYGGGGAGTYASAGPGGASASAGPGGTYAGAGGAYAGAGGAYAGPGPWGFPYWNNGGGAYASSAAGVPDYYDDPFIFSGNRYGNSGSGAGVYSSSDSNGISTRFASVGPGGQATIVEQNGNEPPRVYNYRGVYDDSSFENTRN